MEARAGTFPRPFAVSLPDLGWNEAFAKAYEGLADLGQPYRVIDQQRGQLRVADGAEERWSHVRGRPLGAAAPVIGDWVVAAFPDGEPGVIEAVLPRRSAFSRRAAGDRPDEQVIAANIDVVFLMTGLDQDFNPNRLERYLVAAWQSGAKPVILLNKLDLCTDRDAALARIREIAGEVPIHVLSLLTNEGLEAVTGYLATGVTIGLLGSSGVGKSTLINALVGEGRQRVQDLGSDNRGRHTTTHRELFRIPNGGLMIDTPGMRELQLWDAPAGLDAAFAEIADTAQGCRYTDCGHQNEEDCAVLEAVAAGRIDRGRFDRYHKLKGELAQLALQREGMARIRQRQKTNPMHAKRRRGTS
jgi:ribosome biogenesis GTPase / thiamine phosphate phosphatase